MSASVRVRPRVAIAFPVAAAVLLGCPFAQPVPGVSQESDKGTITPPRIHADAVNPAGTVVPYDTACVGGALFSVQAEIIDDNTLDIVTARWFVDYDPTIQPRWSRLQEEISLPPAEATQTLRTIAPFDFRPGQFPNVYGSALHVVELVVSNNFADVAPEGGLPPLPNRTPAQGYETQVFRWVFQPTTGGRCQ